MKKIIPYILLFMACFQLQNNLLNAQCGERYLTPFFEVETISDVLYGSNINSDGDLQELYLDVYHPVADPLEIRPVVIMAFGGAFIAGSKDFPDMVYLCEEYAKRGFVAVSMQYRIESNPGSLLIPDAMVKAVMRGAQDGKGVIRYLRQTVEQGNPYGIDPDQVFIGGSSAGAFVAMHAVYMTAEDAGDMPEEWVSIVDELGGWEGDSGPSGFLSTATAVISAAGAFGQLEFMDEGEAPIISFHSTDDEVVPYGINYPLGISALPTVYGSSVVHERADELGINNELHTYEDVFHPPYGDGSVFTARLDSMIFYSTQFIHEYLLCPDPLLNIEPEFLGTYCDTTMGSDFVVNCLDSIAVCETTIYGGVDTVMTCNVVASNDTTYIISPEFNVESELLGTYCDTIFDSDFVVNCLDSIAVCETTIYAGIDTVINCNVVASNDTSYVIAGGVGIEDAKFAKALQVYPNPATDIFMVELPANQQGMVTWSLYNQNGQLLRMAKTNASTLSIERENLPSGLYYLQVENAKALAIEKIILQ